MGRHSRSPWGPRGWSGKAGEAAGGSALSALTATEAVSKVGGVTRPCPSSWKRGLQVRPMSHHADAMKTRIVLVNAPVAVMLRCRGSHMHRARVETCTKSAIQGRKGRGFAGSIEGCRNLHAHTPDAECDCLW